jgi:hypothetical protein
MMYSRMKLLLILFTIPAIAFAQEERFFTRSFQKVTSERTSNIRKYSYEENRTIVKDVIQDTVVHEVIIYGTTDREKVNEFTWYCLQNGSELYYREYFKDLKAVLNFYDCSKIRTQAIVRGKEYKFGQVWNRESNEATLVNGSGQNSFMSKDFNETFFEVYEDSILVSSYGIGKLAHDTIHYKVDFMASPKEGFTTFIQKLGKMLNYPGVARLAGKEGRIYVQFAVDKNGELKDFKPLTNEGFNFEEKTIRKLKTLPNWNPAVFKGRRVKQRFVLPVVFKFK